jgi:hypothetical protein
VYKRYLLFIAISLVLFTASVYGLDLTGCQDLNEDYLGQNLVLTQDIYNWTGSCFALNLIDPNAGDDNYLYFDCNGLVVDYNLESNYFLDLNSDVATVSFLDCDFNTHLSETEENAVVYAHNQISRISFYDSNFDLLNNLLNIYDVNILYETMFEFSNCQIDLDNAIIDLNNSHLSDVNIYSLDINTNYHDLDIALFNMQEHSGVDLFSFSNSQIIFDGNGFLFSISNTDYDSIIDFNNLDLNMQNYSQLFSLRGFNNRFEGINLTFKNLNLDENNYDSRNSIIEMADTRLNLDLNDSNIFDLDASFIGRTMPPGDLYIDYNEYFSLSINNSYLDGFAIINKPYLNTFGGTPLISYNSGDINNIYFESIGLISEDYIFDMSNYSQTDDNYLQFGFNGVDANYIGFNSINTERQEELDSNAYFLHIDQLSGAYDLNYIEFNDSSIIMNAGVGALIENVQDNYLNIFGNQSLLVGNMGVAVGDSNISMLEISDLILAGLMVIAVVNTDINYLNGFDLNIVGIGNDDQFIGAIVFGALIDNQIDINLSGSSFYSGDHSTLCSMKFTENAVYNIINISNFDASNYITMWISDANVLDGVVDINTINLFDSDINSWALLYVDENAILDEFNAYNNIFRDVNIDVNYFGQYNNNIGEINLNSILDENKSNRLKLLNDDSNYVGGNLWLDSEGNNLCSPDSSNPKGICDNSLSFIVFDSNTHNYSEAVDYYPLIAYTVPRPPGGGGGNTESFDLILDVNPTSEISGLIDLNLLINITKNGSKKSNDFDYSIYAYEGTQKIKLRDSLDYNNSSLPLTILEQINFKDLDGNILDYIDNNKIKFEIQINVSGDDKLSNNNQVFFVNAYFVEQLDENIVDENIVINVDDSSEDNNEIIIKDVNYDSIYLMTYKEEIGLNEIQIITIFDENKNVISNVNILIFSEELNYYFSTDSNGNVFFKPEKIGIYEIFVPNIDPKIKGKFEVILKNNSSENFVEVYANNTKKGMSIKQRNAIIFGVSGVILISILGVILYFVFRVKKSNFYDFTQTETYGESTFYKNQLAEKYKKEIVEANQEERNLYDKIKPKFS